MDQGIFLVAEDLHRRRLERGWSTTELARATVDIAAEIGEQITLSQQAVSKFENKGLKKTPQWLRYADAALETALLDEHGRREYLIAHFGGYQPLATAPKAEELDQGPSWITVAVPLPSEAALARMFEAQLRNFRDLSGADLARALAKRLPGGLARLQASSLDAAKNSADEPAAVKQTIHASRLGYGAEPGKTG